MNWVIGKNVRCHLQCYSGSNYSGAKKDVQVFPSGRQGDIESRDLSSMGLVAPMGVRVVLCEAPNEEGWEQRPWRAIVLTESDSFIHSDSGHPAVRIPDIDAIDDIRARRTDPDFAASYDHAETLDAGEGWTFGRAGALKGKVQMIRIDKLPAPPKKG